MEQLLVIAPDDLLKLIIHYDQGYNMPLDTELKGVGLSPILTRWIMLECVSPSWPTGTLLEDGSLPPIHIRYEGKKVITINDTGQEPTSRSL